MKNLSIIVPIYNKEAFLEESLKSLLNGVGENSEVLLIDDHSTDGSFSIAQDFAKVEPRIRLLRNKVNAGVGYTRNKGIKESSGKYIGFFDADDQVDFGFYERLYQTAISKNKQMDIAVGGFQCFSNKNLHISFPSISLLIEGVPFSLQRKRMASRETVSCCNKIYHHEFLEGKYFPDYIKEDVYFHYWTMRDAQRVCENRKVSYYYCVKDTGRNLSYYDHPNGDFYDLIEGEFWLKQKIGSGKDLLFPFYETQLQAFLGYIQSIASWHIPLNDQVDLIGTLIEYCRTVYDLNLKLLDPVSKKFYQLYMRENIPNSIDQLKRKLMILSYNYPNRRKR